MGTDSQLQKLAGDDDDGDHDDDDEDDDDNDTQLRGGTVHLLRRGVHPYEGEM